MRKEGNRVVPAQRGAAPGRGGGRAAAPHRAAGTPVPRGIRRYPTDPLGARVRYWFDTTLTRGTPALVGWLALACLVLVVPVSSLLVWTDHRTPASLGSRVAAVWRNTGQTLRLGGEVGPPLRVALSVLLALIALVYVSTLVSLITTGLTDKLIALNRGHSTVLERGHVVVLGWSEQIPTVVTELVAAHTHRRDSVIAVLADRAMADMEEELRATVGATGRTRLICRSGRPSDPVALARVSPGTADCVLVLPRDSPHEDAEVVKTLLALSATVGEHNPVRVVAAVRDDRYLTAARLAGGAGSTVLDMDDISARLLAQCAREPGLSLVHQELLDFAGHELHTVTEPGLPGRTFGEASDACPEASAVGIVRGDGGVELNPPADTPIHAGDSLLVVAEDAETTHLTDGPARDDRTATAPAPPVPHGTPAGPATPATTRAPAAPPAAPPERLLLLGWNRRAPRIADQLARRTPPGSELDVVAEPRAATVTGIRAVGDAVGPRLSVLHRLGDPTLAETMDSLDLTPYDAVIVLGPDRRQGHDDPDDRTLVTLLQVRARERASGRRVPVVTEMTDDRNRLIAPVTPGADFVVSGRTIGLLMTQISQNPHLTAVFEELFAAEGNSLHLHPADRYVTTGHATAFADVVASAARQGARAIGYRSYARSLTAPAHGVRLNPPKAHVRHWHPDDEVVVIAPED
ncbi:NAD-binding lipoprotein [Streptomyces sp. NPDC059352]|uniref:CASTOR/POLLUX-related putative ion channel n=1 Tax=Streptomyces sp. NPDC059352 TaxID=3346810 RepID=UPI0036D0D8F2